MNIYISGNYEADNAKERYSEAESFLEGRKLSPFNPFHNACLASKWLPIRNFYALLGSDGIFMLSDWMESKRAKIEHYVAKEMGLKILYESHMVPDADITDAIYECLGLQFEQYTSKFKGRDGYYARLIFAHYYAYFLGVNETDIGKLVNRDRTTILRCLKLYDQELALNVTFKNLVHNINEFLCKKSPKK